MSTLAVILLSILARQLCGQRTTQIFGNLTLGYYYVEAYVGTPPQLKSLILDTGSRQTIFPCEGCQDCSFHMNGPFNQTNSSSFHYISQNDTNFGWKCGNSNENDQCTFYAAYLEGSQYEGLMGLDRFLFKGEADLNTTVDKTHIFGCAKSETGDFKLQTVDGIIGFGKSSMRHYFEAPTIIEAEFQQGKIASKTFSICLGDNGGQLRLGDWNYDKHFNATEPQDVECSAQDWSDQYYIQVSGIKVCS